MADATRSEVVTHRMVYTLRLPTYHSEVDKAIKWAERDIAKLNPGMAGFGDSLTVEADEDELRIWFSFEPEIGGPQSS